ncbi:MAG TPA: YajD family HNH nuclease [Syntrophorhabdales bacterium]|nr:YajD family HNH nuclease [Syntrophorhabdales bacterium]
MRNKGYTIRKKPADKTGPTRSVDEMLAEVMKQASQTGGSAAYREQSLKIHGLICAKCAREFDHTNQHLLTVHHRDGNPNNNPPDGSNWENLCVYCHDDEHSRGLLGDYFNDRK